MKIPSKISDLKCFVNQLILERAKLEERIAELEAGLAFTMPVADAAVRAQMTGTRFPMELADATGRFRDYQDDQKAAEKKAADVKD